MSRWPSLLQMGTQRVHTWQPRITITLINEQYGWNFFRCCTYCKWPVHDAVVSYKVWSMKWSSIVSSVFKLTHQIGKADLSHGVPPKKNVYVLLTLWILRINSRCKSRMLSLLLHSLFLSFNWSSRELQTFLIEGDLCWWTEPSGAVAWKGWRSFSE